MAKGEELTFSVLGDVSAAPTWWLLGHQGDLAGSPWMDSSTFKYKGLQQAIHCLLWLWEARFQLVGKFVVFLLSSPLLDTYQSVAYAPQNRSIGMPTTHQLRKNPEITVLSMTSPKVLKRRVLHRPTSSWAFVSLVPGTG